MLPVHKTVQQTNMTQPSQGAIASVADAHSAATNYMIRVSQGGAHGFTGPLIPIVFSAQDANGLVIGIDANVLTTDTRYTESQLQEFLGTTASITIKYMYFEDHSGSDTKIDKRLEYLAVTCFGGNVIPDENYDECQDFFDELEDEYNPHAIVTGGATGGATGGTFGMVTTGHSVNPLLAISVDNFLHLHAELNHSFSFGPANKVYAGSVNAAFIPITNNTYVGLNQVRSTNGTIIDVVQGSLFDVPINATLSKFGGHNNTEGNATFLYLNATVQSGADTTHGLTTFTNMGASTLFGSAGDSGAPIIHHANNTHNLVGVYKGTGCGFNANDDNEFVEIRDCSDMPALNINYSFFSAWENVRNALDLQ